MFHFMAICEACVRKDLRNTCGKGAATCQSCWRVTESAEAKLCEHCANHKGCCKFCKTDLDEEFHRITGGIYRKPPAAQPAPAPRAAPSIGRPTALAVLMAALFYTGYYFFILHA